MRRSHSCGLLALLLAGCTDEGTFPQQCGSRLPGWKKPSDGYGVLAIINKVHVLRDGTLKWNGEQISKAELADYSASLPDMNPIPFTILDIEAGAPCRAVIETRRIIDEKAKCRALQGTSVCGEGADPWAQIGDVVGPDGAPPMPYYPEPTTLDNGNESL